MAAMSASQRRATDSTRVCSTALRSKVERLMTLSTSAVAVCCCSDSRSSLSRRAFSMAMTAWSAKFVSRSICLLGEGAHLLPVDGESANQLVIFEHRHVDRRPRSTERDRRGGDTVGGVVGSVAHLLCPHDVIEVTARRRSNRSALHRIRQVPGAYRGARRSETPRHQSASAPRIWPRKFVWHSPAGSGKPPPGRRAISRSP